MMRFGTPLTRESRYNCPRAIDFVGAAHALDPAAERDAPFERVHSVASIAIRAIRVSIHAGKGCPDCTELLAVLP